MTILISLDLSGPALGRGRFLFFFGFLGLFAFRFVGFRVDRFGHGSQLFVGFHFFVQRFLLDRLMASSSPRSWANVLTVP